MWAVFWVDYFAVGQKIRKYRKEKGLSQEELAEKVGISTTHMSHIETANTKLSLPVLVDIARVLNVGTDDLLFDSPVGDSDHTVLRLAAIMDTCTDREKRILADVVQAAADSMKENR